MGTKSCLSQRCRAVKSGRDSGPSSSVEYASAMIVICGALPTDPGRPGLAEAIATVAARARDAVQVIGIVADGPEGDRLLLRLAEAGVGHAAVLRTLDRPMEPADIALALRYLPDVAVIVAADLAADLLGAVTDGAAFVGASLVVIRADDEDEPADEHSTTDIRDAATVLVAPRSDPDGTFAGFVAAFAGCLESGDVPADAWAKTLQKLAVDPVR